MNLIRLTQQQIDMLPKARPRQYQFGVSVGDLLGIPVVKVESFEESTPFLLWKEKAEAEGKRIVSYGGSWYAFDVNATTIGNVE